MNVMRTQHHSRSSSGSRVETTVHVPVLLQEVLTQLNLKEGEVVLDGTLGGGGHARAMAAQIGQSGTLIGLDADSVAIKRTQTALSGALCTLHTAQENFRNFDTVLNTLSIEEVDAALCDLGLSSDQLEASGRGFTFKHDEPLNMSLANSGNTLTAEEIVNEWEEESIADIIFGYGEDRAARRIAHAIVATRQTAPINTSHQLAEIVKAAVPAPVRYGKIHPATKTFQALRITVNDELGALKEFLEKFPHFTAPQARLAIITFHSLEDRIVKHTFKSWSDGGKGSATTKKPIVPTDEEIAHNPRARSAKLRVFQFN